MSNGVPKGGNPEVARVSVARRIVISPNSAAQGITIRLATDTRATSGFPPFGTPLLI